MTWEDVAALREALAAAQDREAGTQDALDRMRVERDQLHGRLTRLHETAEEQARRIAFLEDLLRLWPDRAPLAPQVAQELRAIAESRGETWTT